MNKPDQVKWVLCLVLTVAGVCQVWTQAQTRQNSQSASANIGRNNPFADIERPKTPVVPVATHPSEPGKERPELFAETVTLKFLDAENLKQAIGGMSSEYGSMAVNKKSNSLIVCDTKEYLDKILMEVRKADKTPRQIMIEVVIVDVQLGDDTEIGVNWDILSDKNYDISYRQNFTGSRLRSTIEDADTIGDATAFVTRGLGGDFTLISGTVRNVVHLIRQKRDAKILASPRVMMVSGGTASIEAVEELPYTEVMDTAAGGAAAITSTQFKSVGVQLHVSATLTDNNDIFLTVNAMQNVATGQSDTEIPIVDTRKAQTSLLLQDGQIVILGGLRRQDKAKEVDQIPILGDIPLLGLLFKSTTTVVRNSELIVFLAPHIYKGEPVSQNEIEKFNEITSKPKLPIPDEGDSKQEHSTEVERYIQEHAAVTLELQQEIEQLRLARQQWNGHRQQLERRLEEQAAANEQLRNDIEQLGKAKNRWSGHRAQLEQHVETQKAAYERLQQEIMKLYLVEDEASKDSSFGVPATEKDRRQVEPRSEEQDTSGEVPP